MPHRVGMSKAQLNDIALPASIIESLSSHRLGSFSTTGAGLSARLSVKRLMTLAASIMPTSQNTNAESVGTSSNCCANGTPVMPAEGTHPLMAWQVDY